MKKNNSFKILFICFVVIVLLSCFIKTSVISGTSITVGNVNSIGILGLPQVILDAITKNIDKLLLVLSIGAMYGVLNKIDAYKKLIASIANKFRGKEKSVLLVSLIGFALLSSLFGIGIEIFVFIPFVSQILFALHYDKKTVFAATFGSILIGMIGATFNTIILGGINKYYSFDYTSQLLFKAFIFVITLFLYVTHVIKRVNTDDASSEEKESVISTKKTFPVILFICIISLLVFLGNFKFGSIEGFGLFTDLNNNLSDIELFKNIFGVIPVFGKLGCINTSFVIFIGSLLIAFIYSLKIDDTIDSMFNGVVRVLPSGMVLLFALAISEICNSYPFYLTIVNMVLSHFDHFNIFISSVAVFITSIFVPNIDGVVSILPTVMATSSSDINVMALIAQSIYGIAMLILPTSSLLLFGLSYNKVGYVDWIKYIFKLFLYVLVILLAIFLILILI